MPATSRPIVTLTINPTLDKGTLVSQVMPNKKLRCQKPIWHPGGGGVNVSRVIRRLGGEPLAMLTQGGAAGQMLVDLLQDEGVTCQTIAINGRTRGSLAVREEDSDQQYRFNFPGPEMTGDEWQTVLDAVGSLDPQPRYLVLSGGLPPGVPIDFYARVIEQTENVRIILDTSGEPLQATVASNGPIFLLKPNLRELRALMGSELEDESAQKETVKALRHDAQAQAVVLSLGAAGALLDTADGTEPLRAPTVNIRSKVGAGDSMVAGITWCLAQGGSVREATQFGIAAGAAAVQTPGSELCFADEVHNLYEHIRESDH